MERYKINFRKTEGDGEIGFTLGSPKDLDSSIKILRAEGEFIIALSKILEAVGNNGSNPETIREELSKAYSDLNFVLAKYGYVGKRSVETWSNSGENEFLITGHFRM